MAASRDPGGRMGRPAGRSAAAPRRAMRPEVEQMIDRAAKRTDWAARALAASAEELHAAGEQGALVAGTAEAVQAEAERVAELVRLIEADRERTGSGRVRDHL